MRFALALIPLALGLWAPVVLSQADAARANEAARLQGIVRDASGSVVPSATVTLLRLPSGPSVTRLTDANGRYVFSEVVAGEYEIRVTMKGFPTAVQRVKLERGQRMVRNFTLGLGSVQESVTIVSAAPPSPQAKAQVLGGVVGGVIGGIYRQAPPDFNTEEYGVIREDGFTDVQRKPLSTFSADVDTASYTNIRRFLRDGRMPPKDAVRIEEMLNFFGYDYPKPPAGRPFSTTLELAACPWEKGHQLVHIGLRTAPVRAENLPPTRLTFLLDVSGSMMPPNKLPLLKRSLALLAEQVRPQDKVAIVVYAGAAGVVLEPASGGREDTDSRSTRTAPGRRIHCGCRGHSPRL